MAKLRKLQQTPFLRAIFYGEPGATKTRTACSAALDPRTSPTLVINAAGNPDSIYKYESHPDIIDAVNIKDFNAPYDFFAKGQPENHVFRRTFELEHFAGNDPYKAVVLDQLTDIQHLSFSAIMGATKIGPGDFPTKREYSHYYGALHQMNNLVKQYFSLPMHVIMTAQEMIKNDEETGQARARVMLDGQASVTAPSYAMMVCRLQRTGSISPRIAKALKAAKQEPEWAVGWFQELGNWHAKNQYAGSTLGDYMCDPTITDILDGISGD